MVCVAIVEERYKHFFASGPNFLDPLKTKDGQPYGPARYKQIVKECYLISRSIHTSYNDLMEITPTERTDLLQFMAEEARRSEEETEKIKQMSKSKKKIK